MKRLSEYLFLSFLFLLPFQTVYLLREPMVGGEKWQYGTIGVYVSSLVLAFAVISAAIVKLRSSDSAPVATRLQILWQERRSDAYLLLLVVWAGVSVLWARDRALATYGFLILLLAADAFVMARDMVRRGMGDRIASVLIVSATIQAVIGIAQFVTQETFSSVLLGTSAHPVWQTGSSVLKNATGRFLRAYGTFPHPNIFGLFIAVGLFLAMRQIVETGGKGGSRESWKRIAYIATVPVLFFGLLVSFSRLAWIGFVVGYAVWTAYTYFKNRKLDARRYLAAVTFAVSVSALVFCFALRDTVFPRFDGAIVAREGSVTDRMTTYRDALRVINESPLLGTGMWNSTAELLHLDSGRLVWDIQPAHDVPLLVLTELGIPGLLLAALFIFQILFISVKKKNIAGVAMLLVFFPSFLLDHFLWDSVVGAPFLFFVVGALVDSPADTIRD